MRRLRTCRSVGIAFALPLAVALAMPGARASRAAETPAWLALRPGIEARVDEAPWPVFDEPEAALTAGAASLRRDFSDDFTRPDDIVYEPVGVRIRIVRVLAGGIVLVHGVGAAWQAYAPAERLVPAIPAGTRLTAAGGFAGFADFYPRLQTPLASAAQLPTGTPLVALGMAAAPYDPHVGDLVRVNVRIRSGIERGRTGWISAAYTGVPVAAVPPGSPDDAKACVCRIVRFEEGAAPAESALHHSR